MNENESTSIVRLNSGVSINFKKLTIDDIVALYEAVKQELQRRHDAARQREAGESSETA